MANIEEVKVPDIGGATDVDVIEISVAVGDKVEAEDTLIALESDKASMDVPSPVAGTIKEIKVKVGDKISEGDLFILIETDAASDAPQAEKSEPVAEEKPVEAPAESATSQVIEVTVPDIGGADGVDVIEVQVAVGDEIAKEDSIVTLESDKASMDVPSPFAGTVKEVKFKVGDKASEGDVILLLETTESGSKPQAAAPKQEAPKPSSANIPPPKPALASEQSTTGYVYASPSVRKFARELGVDLTKVTGSGRKGRLTKDDVKQFVKNIMRGGGTAVASGPNFPEIDFSKFGEIETKELSKIKRLTAKNMSMMAFIPQVTQFEEADITELEAFRQQHKEQAFKERGAKLTLIAFVMKALVHVMEMYPQFNSSITPNGESLIMKKYFHIGVAVDTPNGLVVPVIRDVNTKGVFELAKEITDISTKAREKGLSIKEMQGSCMTISSLGGIGGTAFTPIVNSPEVAILGLSKSSMKPIYNGKEFIPKLMLPISLTYDHRVIDGAEAARFTTALAQTLMNSLEMIL